MQFYDQNKSYGFFIKILEEFPYYVNLKYKWSYYFTSGNKVINEDLFKNAYLNFIFRNPKISKSYLLLLYVLLLGKLIELLKLGTPLAAAQLWEEYEKKFMVSNSQRTNLEERRYWDGAVVVLLEKEENCNTPFAKIIAIRKILQDRQSRHMT